MIINPKHLARLFMFFGMLVFANAPAATKDFTLHQAVLDDDKQLVVRLLNKGAAIDVIGSRKYGYGSALHLAVREGNLEIAKSLLRRGAEVDVLDPDDFTPLHNAAWNGNLEMTELLLDAGADINASTYDGDTPLSLAQNNDQAQVAEFIQTRLQASSVVDAKVESVPASDSGVIDISGTYISEMTGKIQDRNRRITLSQSGNIVTGSWGNNPGNILTGTRDGDIIVYNLIEADYLEYEKEGKWRIMDNGRRIEGSWLRDDWNYGGKWNLTKIEPVDFTGTYIADISGKSGLLQQPLFRPKSTEVRKVIITQSGSQITGTYDDGKGKIRGDVEGDTIDFYWTTNRGYSGTGKWTHVPESNDFVGRYYYDSGAYSNSGKWDLTKIEAPSATESGVIDISGTYYISEVSYKKYVWGTTPNAFFGRQPKIEVKISQTGDVITGIISGDRTGRIKGVISGKEIIIDWDLLGGAWGSRFGSGLWLVSNDHSTLKGTWVSHSQWSIAGTWNLTKIE